MATLNWDMVDFASDLPLRPYQRQALQAVIAAFREGKRAVGISLPTGTGKTIIFCALTRGMVEAGGRVLVVVHRDELLQQTLEKLSLVYPDHPPVGVVKAKDFEPDCSVVVASVQTLWRRLDKMREPFDLVVIDEAHHTAADTYLKSVNHFRELNPDVRILGVSATFFRADEKALKCVFEDVVFEYSILEAIADRYLVPLEYYSIKTFVNLDDVGFDYNRGDFVISQLSAAVNTPERNGAIVEAWLERAKGRSTIAFTVDVAHAIDLAQAFREAGVEAYAVTGKTPLEERRWLLEQFKNCKVPVITNCQVLTEGFDAPNASCILLARPTASRVLYAQMVGRGLRLHPDKESCLILDVHDLCTKKALCTFADLDQRIKEYLSAQSAPGDKQGEIMVLDAETVADILDWEAEMRQVFDPNIFHWVPVSYGWAVSLPPKIFSRTTVHIVKIPRRGKEEQERYWAIAVEGGKVRKLTTKPLSDLELVYGVAVEFVRFNAGASCEVLYHKDAEWRQKPPSFSQKNLLLSLGLRVPKTRGEASDLLTKYFAEKDYRSVIMPKILAKRVL